MPYAADATMKESADLIAAYIDRSDTFLTGSTAGIHNVVSDYGAVPDAAFSDGVVATSGSHLTSATAAFVAGDVGKIVWIQHAGTGGYATHVTTIATRVSATAVTLTAAPAVAIAGGAMFGYNTEQNTAFQAALTAMHAARGGVLYVPPGNYSGLAQLLLKDREAIVGAGRRISMLRFKSALNDDCIKIFVGDATTQSAMFVTLKDFGLDGNRLNQTAGTGIFMEGYGFSLSNVYNEDFDTHTLVQNLWIFATFGAGIWHNSGRAGCQFSNIQVFGTDDYGVVIGPDSYWNNIHVGVTGRSCFHFPSTASNVLLTNCQAFNAGQNTTLAGTGSSVTNGSGYRFASGQGSITLSSCSAQDNAGPGFHFYYCRRINLAGCLSDSNGFRSPGTYAGFAFDHAHDNIIEGSIAMNRYVGAGDFSRQLEALHIIGGSVRNRVSITYSADTGAGATVTNTAVTAASTSVAGNDIRVNNQLGHQQFAQTGSTATGTNGTNTLTITPASGSKAMPGNGSTFTFASGPTGTYTISDIYDSNNGDQWTATLGSNLNAGATAIAISFVTYSPRLYEGGIMEIVMGTVAGLTINVPATKSKGHEGMRIVFMPVRGGTAQQITLNAVYKAGSLTTGTANTRSSYELISYDGVNWMLAAKAENL